MSNKRKIWALRIVQNWNQAHYVVGNEEEIHSQSEWELIKEKKIALISEIDGPDEWTSGYVVEYGDGSETFIPLATEGLIVERVGDSHD